MIDISIIVPHYNSTSSLKKLLHSIPVKKNIEVIVVDDRSTENFEEFIRMSKQKEFKHVTFMNNKSSKKGAGVCRNIGLSKSTGKWILFADADDFFVENFYEYISEYFNTNYDVIFFTPTSLEIDTGYESDRHIRYEELLLNYTNSKNIKDETYLRYQFYVPWSKLISRQLIMDNEVYFDEVLASNDVMFSTKIGYYMKNFTVCIEKIYCVTRGSGTLTTNADIDVFDSRMDVHIRYCEFLKQNLDTKKYKILRPHGIGILFNAFKLKLGFSKIISIIFYLKQRKIAIFDIRFLNPLYIVRRLRYHNKNHKRKSRYIINR